MKYFILILIAVSCRYLYFADGNITVMKDNEEERTKIINAIIKKNLNTSDWTNILIIGHLHDSFYKGLQNLNNTFSITNIEKEDYDIEDVVRYGPNVIVMNCLNFEEFEVTLLKAISLPYYHPISKVIVYYHTLEEKDIIAKIFYILWYYRICNAILLQYNDKKESILLFHYSPYICDGHMLQNIFGCRTAKQIGFPLEGFENSFICEAGCRNVSIYSEYRKKYLGTCIGFDSHEIAYGNIRRLQNLNLYEDKAENLHGFTFRAYVTEVLPFMELKESNNGTYILSSRDGTLWRTISNLMNFSIDFSPSLSVMKQRFRYDLNIQQIFSFTHRKGDLYLGPIYQMDLIIVEIDITVPYKESGVCLMSQRADFDTTLFNVKLLYDNYTLFIKFLFSFVGVWFVFYIFNVIDKGYTSFDQVGIELMNTIRNTLLISVHRPSKHRTFRIFFTITIWSYFVINFGIHAAIISFFSVFKRGKEVDTFEDVIEKGFIIEGMSSPDVVLPDDEERFQKINSKLVPVDNLYECIHRIANDSHRFCLIDCAIGRYIERNWLNNKGEQYLHVAKDRIHSHYLNIIFPKHSPLTKVYNKHIFRIVEAGLIRKWEQYKYSDMKNEAPFKPLGMEDFLGIFQGFGLLLGICSMTFSIEIVLGAFTSVTRYCSVKFKGR